MRSNVASLSAVEADNSCADMVEASLFVTMNATAANPWSFEKLNSWCWCFSMASW